MLRLSVGEVMEVNDELYLTDEQYLRILKKIETTVGQGGFKVSCADYTVVGQKFTNSNCGFCNSAYTEKGMALFPDQFPVRRTMKYRRANHRCPFDMRNNAGFWSHGCFFECYLFKHRGKRDWSLSLMREMVDHVVEVAR